MGPHPPVKIAQGLLIAAVVAVLLYTFAPKVARRTGSVREPEKRTVMPLFSMPTIAGEEWRLGDHKGKVLVVNFWATWCPPCREETPALVKLANRYRARGFEVIGISMDNDPKSVVPAFVSRYQVSYPVLMPTAESALADAIESLPTSFLLDRQGRVARTYVGAVDEGELEPDVELLLAEKDAPLR